MAIEAIKPDAKSCDYHPPCNIPAKINEVIGVINSDMKRRDEQEKIADKERKESRAVQNCIQEKTNDVHTVLFGNKKINHKGLLEIRIEDQKVILDAITELGTAHKTEIEKIHTQLQRGDKLLNLNRVVLWIWTKLTKKPMLYIVIGLALALVSGMTVSEFFRSVILQTLKSIKLW